MFEHEACLRAFSDIQHRARNGGSLEGIRRVAENMVLLLEREWKLQGKEQEDPERIVFLNGTARLNKPVPIK
jgi:hypothetical protein